MDGRIRVSVGWRCRRERDSWWRPRRNKKRVRHSPGATHGFPWSSAAAVFFLLQFGVCAAVEGERAQLGRTKRR